MINRKELKKRARKNVKEHIVIFIIICAIASFIGAEFVGSLYYTTANNNYTIDNIITGIMENGIDSAKGQVENNLNNLKNEESDVLGRSNGVFALVINAFSSGSLFLVVFSVIKNVFKSQTVTLAIITIGSLGMYFVFWYFITNIFNVLTGCYAQIEKENLLENIKIGNKRLGPALSNKIYKFFIAEKPDIKINN